MTTATPLLSCDELRDRLLKISDMMMQLGQPGVRSVRDTDGSEIQYSQASFDALRTSVRGWRRSTTPAAARIAPAPLDLYFDRHPDPWRRPGRG